MLRIKRMVGDDSGEILELEGKLQGPWVDEAYDAHALSAAQASRTCLDLSGLRNLHGMANTPDPRDFYRVSRAVLVPSLWGESLGRVLMEAMANGIPRAASDRGALPETLGNAGFVFTIPERFGPSTLEMPTAREVAPSVAVPKKLWDDPEFEARHRALARAEAQRWEPRAVAGRFQNLLRSFIVRSTHT